MKLSFYTVWRFENFKNFRRPSWIYANCTSCQRLAELLSSQITSITSVKDNETKQFIVQTIYKFKLRAQGSVKSLKNKTVNSDYVGV